MVSLLSRTLIYVLHVWYVRILEDDDEAERTLQARLTRNRNLVDIKVAALLRIVEPMVGDCLLVLDAAATAQDTLRSFHSTGRAATVASTTAAAAPARALCNNNYLLLLPKELLDQVRPMAFTTVLWPGVQRLTGTAFVRCQRRCCGCCCERFGFWSSSSRGSPSVASLSSSAAGWCSSSRVLSFSTAALSKAAPSSS
jgi:hypothetical protein